MKIAVDKSSSYRQVLSALSLQPTGGNYAQLKKYVGELELDTSKFKGHAWNKGMKGLSVFRIPLENILKENTNFQSYKLKRRLIISGLKQAKCELCDWAMPAADGRIPLELDHINGKRTDNRLDNLRILCPNCHSLQPTHRGKNRESVRASAGIGIQG